MVDAKELEVKPFSIDDFLEDKIQENFLKSVTKKELKALAKKLDLDYDNAQIAFTKKLLHALVVYR